jgi:transposase
MGKPHRRFGKEFEAEAVRLVKTSGRTQREIAEGSGHRVLDVASLARQTP